MDGAVLALAGFCSEHVLSVVLSELTGLPKWRPHKHEGLYLATHLWRCSLTPALPSGNLTQHLASPEDIVWFYWAWLCQESPDTPTLWCFCAVPSEGSLSCPARAVPLPRVPWHQGGQLRSSAGNGCRSVEEIPLHIPTLSR